MESQPSPKDVIFCLSPSCPSPESRIHLRSKAALHLGCSGWCVPQRTVPTYTRASLCFAPSKTLPFASSPLQAQAYVFFYSGALRDVAGGLVASLRRSIGRQIDMFEERLQTVVEGICSFEGFEKIVHLAEQTKLSMNNRSMRLQAVLGEGLPRWEDFALPSYEDIREVVRKLEDALTAMASIRTRTNCEGRPIDLDATDAGEREEKAEEEGEEEVRERKKESTAVLPEVQISHAKEEFAYKKEGRSQTQNSERQIPGEQQMRVYAKNMCSLATAEALMGQGLPNFFSMDSASKEIHWICSHCPLESTFRAESKAAGKAQAAREMVRHLLSSHRFISTYNYTHRITKQAIEEISIPELITLAQAPHIRKVYIVDRSSSFYFEHILDDLEPSFAVEILPYGERPHSGCEFMRRNGGEEVLLLLGMAIYAVGVRMGKSVVIYCGEGRAGKVESLCGEVGVRARVVVGKGKKATRIDVRPGKTLAVSDRTVKLIKLEQ